MPRTAVSRVAAGLLTAAAVALIVSSAGGSIWAAPGLWIPRFDGMNLQGWEAVHGGRWTVEDGAIVMRRVPGDSGGAWLFTKKDYEDFVLRLKFLPGSSVFHSGILVREPGHGKITRPAFSGYEISLAQGIRRQNTTGAIYFSANAYLKDIPAHEWSTIEIRCLGDHITTFVNGQKMAETHVRRSFKGGIGLHLHGGSDQPEIRWKDIELQELPPKPRGFQNDEERLAQLPGDFQAVTDLPSAPGWTWSDGVLRGKTTTQPINIQTKTEYGDFIFGFDFRLSTGGSGGAVFRVPPGHDGGYEFHLEDQDDVNPSGSIFNLARAFVSEVCDQKIYHTGKWNQARIYAADDHIVTYLNLAKGAEVHDDRSRRGQIGFRVAPGSWVEFRNIEVKRIR